MTLSAAGSKDPEGNALARTWWVYPAAGTLRGDLKLGAVSGPPLVRSRVAWPASVITPGEPFLFSAEHRGSQLDIFIDCKPIQTVNLYGENITLGTREPLVTGTRRTESGPAINSITYHEMGLIV